LSENLVGRNQDMQHWKKRKNYVSVGSGVLAVLKRLRAKKIDGFCENGNGSLYTITLDIAMIIYHCVYLLVGM
jgi:hypothetical protein